MTLSRRMRISVIISRIRHALFSAPIHVMLAHWLQEAQRAVDSLPPDDYGLYELLHEQASCLAPVDSCYFCLYRHDDETLFFSYNFDGELYDEPLTLPLGAGPTSWVVRTGEPFVLSEQTRPIHHGNADFGDDTRVSNSAIHLPVGVRTTDKSGRPYTEVLGVFSIQSYQFDVYSTAAVAALQLLCDYAALHLQRKREQLHSQRQLKAASERSREYEAHKIRMANHFVELLQPLSRQSQTLLQTLAPDQTPTLTKLRGQAVELSRLCGRLQTQVSQLPIDNRPLPLETSTHLSPAYSTLAPDNPLDALSRRECEVLRLVATGAKNEKIALELSCTIHTAKKHCSNIYQKLKVENRTEATHFYHRYAGSAKNSRKSNEK